MFDLSPQAIIACIVALLALSAVFSSSETALFCLNRLRLESQEKEGSHTAARLLHLLNNADKTLGLILICNNIVNVAASSLVTVLAIKLYGNESVAVAVGILTFLILVFSEITPKTLATIRPELIAYPVAWVYPALMKVIAPFLNLLRLLTRLLLYPFYRKGYNRIEDEMSSGELRTLLMSSRIKLPKRRTWMMLGILDFEKLLVEDAMVLRNDIQAIDISKSWNDILEQIKMYTYSTILFYRENLDDIQGTCACRNLLDLFIEGRLSRETLISRIEEPLYVVEGTLLSRAVIHFQKNAKAHFALVLNEYDHLQGLLTRKDIFKRLYSNTPGQDSGLLRRETDDTYSVEATIKVSYLNSALNIQLPTDEGLTLNGLIIHRLESIPQKGVSLQIQGVTFEVVKAERNQLQLIRITLPTKAYSKGGG